MSNLSFRKISAVLCAMFYAALSIAVTLLSLLAMQPAHAATNSNVLNYLYSISGTKTISGQHNREPNSNPVSWTNWIYNVTGKYPGLWGGDFLYLHDDVNNRWTMIKEAKEQWNKGSLVTLMWHVCPPTITQTFCDWDNGIRSDLTDAQWDELLTDGTPLNSKWKDRIDEIVPYLQYLQCNGVEVLWRPLHEMNDESEKYPGDPHPGWCWWCGRRGENGSRKLYQITYNYMTYEKGLTNLIWVWNVKDITPTTTILTATLVYSSYYPRDEDVDYVDVVSMDPWNYGFTAENYSATLIIANGKPIAIGETEELPLPDVLAAQPSWTWFLGWAEEVTKSNTITEIRAVYNDPRVVNRGDIILEDLGNVCIWLPVILP